MKTDIPELEMLIAKITGHTDKIFKKYHQLTANEELRNFFIHYVCISLQLKMAPDDNTWKEKLSIIEEQILKILSQPKQEPKKGDIV